MMKITPSTIAGILYAMNWQGHIELPDIDIRWIAEQVSNALNGRRHGVCDNCGASSVIIIKAVVGDICEDCIGGIGRLADEMRRDYENA